MDAGPWSWALAFPASAANKSASVEQPTLGSVPCQGVQYISMPGFDQMDNALGDNIAALLPGSAPPGFHLPCTLCTLAAIIQTVTPQGRYENRRRVLRYRQRSVS